MDKEEKANKACADIPWPDLTKGILLKRYKRFLANVRLDTNEVVTCHCANSGAMLKCSEPGKEVYLSFHASPKRKLKYTWEIIHMKTSFVGVNTNIPNRLVKKSIENNLVEELRQAKRNGVEILVYDSIIDLMKIRLGRPIPLKFCS